MAFVHGKSSVFKVAGTDISAYLTKVSFKPNSSSGETTVLGKNSKTYIAGLKDGTIQCEFKFDAALLTVILANWAASATWEYAPEGTASGKTKLTGSGILEGFPFDSDVSQPVGGSFNIQITGDITSATYP